MGIHYIDTVNDFSLLFDSSFFSKHEVHYIMQWRVAEGRGRRVGGGGGGVVPNNAPNQNEGSLQIYPAEKHRGTPWKIPKARRRYWEEIPI